MTYPELDDAEFQGQIAIEFATRPATGMNGWQKRVTKEQRDSLIRNQAALAAHLANEYLTRNH